jgi:hypothetical protein
VHLFCEGQLLAYYELLHQNKVEQGIGIDKSQQSEGVQGKNSGK